ncbi:MAG: type II toxin-antitoxin system Phd/YefM family antitoxin [Kiritimatiellaeota bacterium]|nr:type II toxin-antitoxin system Phd/YefM family antitoxin [Kiritimatiellota bacterium]
MKVFTYSQARQALATVLDTARKEEVLITRRGGDKFAVTYKAPRKSPFDVPGIKTRATTRDILEAIKESRSRGAEHGTAQDGESADASSPPVS